MEVNMRQALVVTLLTVEGKMSADVTQLLL